MRKNLKEISSISINWTISTISRMSRKCSKIRTKNEFCSGKISNFHVKETPFKKRQSISDSLDIWNSPITCRDSSFSIFKISAPASSKIMEGGLKFNQWENECFLSRNSSTTFSSPKNLKRKAKDYLFTISTDSISLEEENNSEEVINYSKK